MAKGHGREGCGSIFHEPWRTDCSPKFPTTTEVFPLGNGDEVCHGQQVLPGVPHPGTQKTALGVVSAWGLLGCGPRDFWTRPLEGPSLPSNTHTHTITFQIVHTGIFLKTARWEFGML